MKIIGITGSDGKTTTTTLIYEILKANGYNCYLGGNIGTPLFTKLNEMTPDDIIVEVNGEVKTAEDGISVSVVEDTSATLAYGKQYNITVSGYDSSAHQVKITLKEDENKIRFSEEERAKSEAEKEFKERRKKRWTDMTIQTLGQVVVPVIGIAATLAYGVAIEPSGNVTSKVTRFLSGSVQRMIKN